MTTELSSTAAADLPPRTWRQWWRQLPGYWRIAGWTVFILVLLHVALVAWMIPGYFESTEITKLRQHGAVIRYAWESNTGAWSDQYMNWLMPGIHGRSAAQVAEINLSDVFTDNRILEYIGQHFPNLQHLRLNDPNHKLKPSALESLQNCQRIESLLFIGGLVDEELLATVTAFPGLTQLGLCRMEMTAPDLSPVLKCDRLRNLYLNGSSVDDDQLQSIGELKKIRYLSLRGTRITDASLPILQGIKTLQHLDLSYTDTTFPAIKTWRNISTSVSQIKTDHDLLGTHAIIRWADGRLRGEYECPHAVYCFGPLTEDGGSSPSAKQTMIMNHQLDPELSRLGDGTYQLILKYDDVESEPVTVQVQNGAVPPGRIEFRMPVTKAEALRATSSQP